MNGDGAHLQKHIPEDVLLATVIGGQVNGGTVRFYADVPDSRLRVKLSILGVPKAGGAENYLVAVAPAIWIAAFERDMSGTTGIILPVVDLVGTRALKTVIPFSADLGGWSKEFVTAADIVGGEIQVPAPIAVVGDGNIWLQARYQPDAGQRFTADEWAAIKSLCNIRAVGGIAIATAPIP